MLGKEVVNLVWELAYYLTNYKIYFEHMSFWGLRMMYINARRWSKYNRNSWQTSSNNCNKIVVSDGNL